ncbi:MAG: hypothetical protein ACI92I_000869 [Acidimicrobiales bacterium]|jgi:hypothetical protein
MIKLPIEESAWCSLQNATGKYDKFIYGLYLVTAIVMFGSATHTALNTLSLLNDHHPWYAFLVLAAFIIIQALAGYGFLFLRKWVLTLFSIMFVFDVCLYLATFTTQFSAAGNHALSQAGLLLLVMSLIYITKEKLKGSYTSLIPVGLYTACYCITSVFTLQYMVIEIFNKLT